MIYPRTPWTRSSLPLGVSFDRGSLRKNDRFKKFEENPHILDGMRSSGVF